MDGIININKEKGYTSHDVVAVMRKLLHIKKIGHTGTLDPDATGVLPVCVGKATKVCDVITDRDKTYEAKVVLGITTDTLDTSGEILKRKPVSINKDDLMSVLSHFEGDIEQIPPMYSAIKVDGKKLYEYARQGVEIERKARQITIHSIELISDDLFSWDPADGDEKLPSFMIRVRCSKGTYIRTLCDDIGRELGCGAAMSELRRTAVGRFLIEDALSLSDIEKKLESFDAEKEDTPEFMLPVDKVFEMYPDVAVKSEHMKLLLNGNPLEKNMVTFHSEAENNNANTFRVYGDDGEFYALYKSKGKRLFVEKFFH